MSSVSRTATNRQNLYPGSRGIAGWPWEIVGLLAVAAAIPLFGSHPLSLFSSAAAQTWTTVFLSIVIQALPFLAFGVALSAAIAAFVPSDFLSRVLPKNPAMAVPVAGAAGAVLPGCECASVPVARSMIASGIAPAAAFSFLLAAPAINPIVLISTAVAFPGKPEMVLARLIASLGASVVIGWIWAYRGKTEWLRVPKRSDARGKNKWAVFHASAQHDLLHAGGFLVVGGITAATLNVMVPRSLLGTFAHNPVTSILVMAGLAVALAICSEADAFVAASLSQFSLTSRLVFLVVGPMVDVKLIALQAGTFGRAFASRFAPATFMVAVLIGTSVGLALL